MSSKKKKSKSKESLKSSGSESAAALGPPPSSGYLISCDVPTKQFIQHLDETKPVDKKFIIKDLDATHLLVKAKAREEISRKVEEWMDDNVFSSVEKVGEDLDMS